MTIKIRFVAIGSLAIIGALLLSACGAVSPFVVSQPAPGPNYGYSPGGMMSGGMGNMMGGEGMMGSGMMGSVPNGMMGGYGYSQSAPTAEPTPFGATPVPVDEEIQITVLNLRFSPAVITVKPGESVRFVVTNKDPYLHNFVGEQAGIPFLNLPGNTTQTVVWTAPVQSGTYTALCTLHPGMRLAIIIKE